MLILDFIVLLIEASMATFSTPTYMFETIGVIQGMFMVKYTKDMRDDNRNR